MEPGWLEIGGEGSRMGKSAKNLKLYKLNFEAFLLLLRPE